MFPAHEDHGRQQPEGGATASSRQPNGALRRQGNSLSLLVAKAADDSFFVMNETPGEARLLPF